MGQILQSDQQRQMTTWTTDLPVFFSCLRYIFGFCGCDKTSIEPVLQVFLYEPRIMPGLARTVVLSSFKNLLLTKNKQSILRFKVMR